MLKTETISTFNLITTYDRSQYMQSSPWFTYKCKMLFMHFRRTLYYEL